MTDATLDSEMRKGMDDIYATVARDLKRRQRNERLKGIAEGTAAIAALMPLTYWHGYVVSTLWAWFLQPLLGHPLPIYYAVGLILFARLVVNPFGIKTQKIKGLADLIALQLAVPGVALGVGYVWKWLGWGL